MENETKEYKAIVDKDYKIFVIVVLLAIFYISIAISSELQSVYPDLNIDFWMPFLALVMILIFCMLLEKFVDFKEVMTATFQENQVILKRKNKERIIPYKKIKKVVKYMIINRTYQDKGKYRVIIKCRGRNYVMYSGEDSDLKLDFECTEISKIYKEFKHRGIMCC